MEDRMMEYYIEELKYEENGEHEENEEENENIVRELRTIVTTKVIGMTSSEQIVKMINSFKENNDDDEFLTHNTRKESSIDRKVNK